MLPITLVVIGVLLVVFFWFTGIYTDVLWYDQLGSGSVLWTRWITMGALFLVGLAAMGVPLFLVLVLAYRNRPVYARLSQQLDAYQRMLEPIRRTVFVLVPLIAGVIAGLGLIGDWQTVLEFFQATPFGQTDPQFGFDIAFFVFQLPFWRGVITFASATALIAFLLTAAVEYLYGGIRVTGRELVISRPARIQIAVLAGVYLLIQGVSLWFDQYTLLTSVTGKWNGAMYTDVNGRIPGLAILAGAAAVVAVLFFIAAAIGRWRLPLAGIGLLIVVALVIGVAYPWGLQQFQVGPNEESAEAPYIQRNIDATRYAYGLDQVQEVPYQAQTTASAGQLRRDAATTANLRILDPAVVSPTFAQFEQEKAYYQFPQELDVDRYELDGQTRDAVLAVRDINIDGLPNEARSWVNESIVYTHGYGMVAAFGNQRGPDGQPVFFAHGMPQQGSLDDFEPRIYFSPNSPEYSIVGAPENSEPREFDHVQGANGDTETQTTFNGSGGPSLGNLFNRLAYAVKFRSEQILLSQEYINPESQILYDRDPVERVEAAAPYLQIDSDPYPAVVDGRIKWIIDGYTTTNAYPYSSQQSIDDAIQDTVAIADPLSPTSSTVNYIRNSVKATVDAYDGSVELYAWDTDDPILKTWQKILPNTVKPVSEMSGDLLSHVRYPQDMFKVQRTMFASYHVQDAATFYKTNNAWQLPADPTAGADETNTVQAPYYLTMQMPDTDPAFSIYTTYIPKVNEADQTRSVLTGYLSANGDAGSTAGQVDGNYGKLTLLRIENDAINGPGQVQNIFDTNDQVADQLNLWQRGGSTTVERGNLLTVPVGGGFLYIQPVYVRSAGETSYPLMRRVLVAFGNAVAFEPTLDQALDVLFGGDSGTDAGDSGDASDDSGVEIPDTGGTDVPADDAEEDGSTPTATGEPAPTSTGAPATGTPAQQELASAIADAQQALLDRTAAYQENDLVAAAEADSRLVDALNRAQAAQERVDQGE